MISQRSNYIQKNDEPNPGIKKAAAAVGSLHKLSQLCGVAYATAFRWLYGKGNNCPPERAVQIERLLEGRVTRAEIRPDLFL